MKNKKYFFMISVVILIIGVAVFILNGEKSNADEGKAVFSSTDFSCQKCDQKVESVLNNMIGIENFKMNKKNHEVIVFYDQTIMKPEWIEKSLEASGFSKIKLE